MCLVFVGVCPYKTEPCCCGTLQSCVQCVRMHARVSGQQAVIFIRHIWVLLLCKELLMWYVVIIWTEMLEWCVILCVHNVFTFVLQVSCSVLYRDRWSWLTSASTFSQLPPCRASLVAVIEWKMEEAYSASGKISGSLYRNCILCKI
jgi:hypothetical protein